ncbi:MAG: tetratricopeptide repeat protein, partial [Omnitrophica bacterium]|nr:tetratricopeptide repeat protein [Candidatus Omnitrophota bacterium]
GNSYEKQNQWNRALREYTTLRDKYSDTPLALEVPLYIGNYYKGKKRYTQANKAYHEATIFYKRIERENRGKPRGYACANLSLRAYLELKDYEQAGKIAEDIINNYPQLIALVQQAINIDLIFIKKLNKPEKAIELYTLIQTKTDDPKLKQALGKTIEFLKAQKEF